MIVVQFRDTADVSRLIDGLLEAAAACETARPQLARTYTDLSNRVADELDALPFPSSFRAQVELQSERHRNHPAQTMRSTPS